MIFRAIYTEPIHCGMGSINLNMMINAYKLKRRGKGECWSDEQMQKIDKIHSAREKGRMKWGREREQLREKQANINVILKICIIFQMQQQQQQLAKSFVLPTYVHTLQAYTK